MECHDMLLHRGLRLEVDWLTDATGANQPHLLKVSFNLSTDNVIIVGHHHLVAIDAKVVEPSVLGFSQRASALRVLELKTKAAVFQMVVHDHEVGGAFLVALLPALKSRALVFGTHQVQPSFWRGGRSV